MEETNKNDNGNGKRKWFPGVRIIEGLVITVGAGIMLALAGNFILIPKLELKLEMEVKSICSSLQQIQSGILEMQKEIIILKLNDKEHEGDIELLRYHTGLKGKKKVDR